MIFAFVTLLFLSNQHSNPFVILSMTPMAPVKSKKDERGYRVENFFKGGAGFAPFILTLDNIFNAHTIERGLKRSAFC